MAVPTLAERVSSSFQAWERRGRGWDVAGYPVALEPPFRPFGLIPLADPERRHIDDGKRPTFLSVLAEKVGGFFEGAKPKPLAPVFEEQAPFPAYSSETIATKQVLVARDFRADSRTMAQLLPVLTSGWHPVAFEIVGSSGKAAVQIACGEPDAPRVFGAVSDIVPSVALVDSGDLVARSWLPGGYNLVVDFGYADEFFLSLPGIRAFSVDPYASVVSACARAMRDEVLCFQVLVTRALNPWPRAIREAVMTADGKPLFSDAPEFVGAARQKTEGFLYAAVVRVGASAVNEYRVLDLVRGTAAFFDQFARPDGNRLVPLDNENYPAAAHEKALLGRMSYRTGMILSGDELLPLIHFPDETVRSEALMRAELRTKALPEVARGHATVVGENEHRGERDVVTIDIPERLQHTMIVGASGTGKSKLLVNLIRQDMERGEGLAVLDPHGDLIDEVLSFLPDHRRKDVVLFDPSDEEWPIGFNILAAKDEVARSVLASDLVGIFARLSTSWGDGMSTVLANAILAVTAHPERRTLVDLRRFLVDDGYRKEFLATIADPDVQFFWTKEWPLIGSRSIGPILTRLNTFLRPKVIRHIVGQQNPKLDLGAVVEGQRIFLAKLSQGLIGNENAYLLGSLLLSTFLQHALARQRLAKADRVPFWLYLDEAEHFVTPSVASLLTEARKYGVGLHLAFQMLSQLRAVPQVESAVLGNAHTRIVFRVGDDDARRLADGFSFFDGNDLRSLSRGQAIARFGEASNDCSLRTARVEPVTQSVAAERTRNAVDHSRLQYGTPLATLTAELHIPGTAARPLPVELVAASAQTSTGASNDRPIPPDSPPQARSLADVPKAKASNKHITSAPLGRGGPEHKYLQHLIQRLAEERGFRAVIEEQVPGGQVDVVLRRGQTAIACEVSVTTDAAHELENLAKCLAAGFTTVWLVVADKKRQAKLTPHLAEGAMRSVTCLATEDLVAALDAASPQVTSAERVVGGYRVKINRKPASSTDAEARRDSAIAEIVARSLIRQHKP